MSGRVLIRPAPACREKQLSHAHQLSNKVKVTSNGQVSRTGGWANRATGPPVHARVCIESCFLLLPFIPSAVMDVKVVAVLFCLSAFFISANDGKTGCSFFVHILQPCVCLCGSKEKRWRLIIGINSQICSHINYSHAFCLWNKFQHPLYFLNECLFQLPAGIPGCCISTTKRIPVKVLLNVVKWTVQKSSGACDIDAVV